MIKREGIDDYDAGACEAFQPDPREPWVCMCGVHGLRHVLPGSAD